MAIDLRPVWKSRPALQLQLCNDNTWAPPSDRALWMTDFLLFFKFIFRERRREGEKEGEKYGCIKENINWLSLAHPHLGTWPTTQACTLTGNQTHDLSIHRPVLNPLSHTSQGWVGDFMLNVWSCILQSGISSTKFLAWGKRDTLRLQSTNPNS